MHPHNYLDIRLFSMIYPSPTHAKMRIVGITILILSCMLGYAQAPKELVPVTELFSRNHTRFHASVFMNPAGGVDIRQYSGTMQVKHSLMPGVKGGYTSYFNMGRMWALETSFNLGVMPFMVKMSDNVNGKEYESRIGTATLFYDVQLGFSRKVPLSETHVFYGQMGFSLMTVDQRNRGATYGWANNNGTHYEFSMSFRSGSAEKVTLSLSPAVSIGLLVRAHNNNLWDFSIYHSGWNAFYANSARYESAYNGDMTGYGYYNASGMHIGFRIGYVLPDRDVK